MILSKYSYHGKSHLEAMLHDEYVQKYNTEYIATILWSIGRTIAGDQYPLPSYDEFWHPKKKDGRTKDEIIADLIDKLLPGGGETNAGTVQGSGENGSRQVGI